MKSFYFNSMLVSGRLTLSLTITGPGHQHFSAINPKKIKENNVLLKKRPDDFRLHTNCPSFRVKSLVGACCRLQNAPRLVFLRFMMLFSLTSTFEDDDQANSQQLFQILQVNRGLITYPTYKIQRKTRLFRWKDDLVQFQVALNMYSDILAALEGHAFDVGINLYRQAKLFYAEHCANEELIT
jgi:hypothetical protein